MRTSDVRPANLREDQSPRQDRGRWFHAGGGGPQTGDGAQKPTHRTTLRSTGRLSPTSVRSGPRRRDRPRRKRSRDVAREVRRCQRHVGPANAETQRRPGCGSKPAKGANPMSAAGARELREAKARSRVEFRPGRGAEEVASSGTPHEETCDWAHDSPSAAELIWRRWR